MCRLKHKEGQFSHRPLLSPMKGRGRTDAGRGEGTDTKLGPSQLMKERHRRENREGERERECPSNGYTETEGEIEGAREDLSLEDMSNSHATGSNAWESRQLLSGLTAASLTFFFIAYSARLQQAKPASSVLQGKPAAVGRWGPSSSTGSCMRQKSKYQLLEMTRTEHPLFKKTKT